MTAVDCREFAESAPELALGVLTGAERARVLAHLEQCLSCRFRLDRLNQVTDAVLEVVTPVDPPLGFDVRVAAALAPRRSRLSRSQVVARAAAAALIALIAGVGGWLGATATRSAPPSPVVQAPLTSGAQAVGRIFLYPSPPSWVYVTVDLASYAGGGHQTVTCELESAGGREIPVGTFTLTDGYGYWGAPVPSGTGGIRGARIVTAGGTVLAAARLGSS